MKIKIKNLDEVYSLIKSEVGKLKLSGWDAQFNRTVYEKSETLLMWFKKNLSEIKLGCNKIPIAFAEGEAEYAAYSDQLFISSTKTNSGLLVEVITDYYFDNGFHDYSGRYKITNGTRSVAFLLKIEEV